MNIMKTLIVVLVVALIAGCAGAVQKIEKYEHEIVQEGAYIIGDSLEVTLDTVQTIRSDLEKVEENVCKKLDKSPHITCSVQK